MSKRVGKIISIMLVVLLSMTVIIGCSNNKSQITSEQANSEVVKDDSREITDMAGRKVKVKKDIQKVFCTSPVGTIATYTLDPDKLVGWNYELSSKEKEFILPEYHELPALGGWFGKNTGSVEEILKIEPDIIISMGTIRETDISTANRLQEQLKIPVVLVEGELSNLDEMYSFLGELLGSKERAKELANYCKSTVEEIKSKAEKIPEDKKLRVYYAEGPDGLETDPEGSMHTKVLEMVGGINVAKVDDKGGSGRSDVSMEQLLAWNPEVILSWDRTRGGYYDKIFEDEAWKTIKAVREGKVYAIPNKPFNWFDRPPSVNRVLGLKWLSNLLYPDVFDFDIREEVKDFYKTFYHYDLSDEQVDDLLEDAIRK